MAWARNNADGVVAEVVTTNPAGHYHPDLVWYACLDATKVGDRYVGGVLQSAAVAAPSTQDLLSMLAAERYARECAGVMFQAAGASSPSLVTSDEASQGKLTSAYQLAKDGHWVDGVPWKMADGSFVPLTSADVQAMAVRVGLYVGACFAHEGQLAAALASNPVADITQGWPSNA